MFGDIPFNDFASSGKHHQGFRSSHPQEPIDTTKLYETLEVPKDAASKDIKKSYHRLSREHHPDKGGDEHLFKEINAAYEVLSDPDKRAAYDKYGIEAVNDHDLGRRRRRSGRIRPRKGPNVNHPIKVDLEDLYHGKTIKLSVTRKVIVGEVKECNACDGDGLLVETVELYPGVVQQVQQPCNACQGQGSLAETKNEKKVLEVHIDKGMRHNEKITFRGMSDEYPKMEPGDINFIIQERDHPVFKRKGADLLMTKVLSLNQALCGFQSTITHLDGRKIQIKSRPGEVIRPEANNVDYAPFVKMIKDEGMPSRGNPFVRGNLYVMFKVRFPEDNELTADAITTLKSILPEPDMEAEYDPDEVEEAYLDHAQVEQFGKGGSQSTDRDAYESDDENGEGLPVQCQQS